MKRSIGILLAICAVAGASAQDKERAIEKSVKVAAPVSEVWKAWTTSEGVRQFLGVGSTIQLKFGGRYEWYFGATEKVGVQGSEGCQILSYVPEKMLSFTWNAPPSLPTMRNQRTFVVINLTPTGTGTQVDFRHAGWGTGPDWDKHFAYFDKAWDMVLGALVNRFEKGPITDIPKAPAAPPVRNEDALDKMASLIGGVWRGRAEGADGPFVIEFKYRRHRDGKGVIGEGVLGKGSKDEKHVFSQFGWDPVAKAVYYFDTHDSETLYFGHINVEKDDLIFTFAPVGMLPQVFGSRNRMVDKDTMQTIIADAAGKEIVGFTLKREKA